MIMDAMECSASVHFGRQLHESSCCALSPFEFVLAVLSVSLLHNEPVSVGVVCELLAIMQRWNSHDNFGSGVDCCSSPLSATLPRNLAVIVIDIGFFFTTSNKGMLKGMESRTSLRCRYSPNYCRRYSNHPIFLMLDLPSIVLVQVMVG